MFFLSFWFKSWSCRKTKRDNYFHSMKMLVTCFISHSHWQQTNYLNNQYRSMSLANEEMRTMWKQITLLLMLNNQLQFRTQTCLTPSFFLVDEIISFDWLIHSIVYNCSEVNENHSFSHTFILTVCISVQLVTGVFTWMLIDCLNTAQW